MALSETEEARCLELATEMAREAGGVLLEHLGRLDPLEITSKSAARDLVTAADVASERHLVARLREAFPDHHIESEEEVQDDPDASGPRWFVDPLDGTVNFVHRLPCFGVSMGLWVDGEPRVAVVHAPRLEETFTARAGAGACLNGRPIHVSAVDALGDALLATGFPYRRSELEHSNLENFGRFYHEVRDLRRMGSAAIDLCYLADGRLDGFWELHLSPHDVAAGGLIVREAGGLVTDADGGEDWLRGGSLVAAGPGLHGAILERVEH